MKTAAFAVFVALLVGLVPAYAAGRCVMAQYDDHVKFEKYTTMEKKNYYCEYCGHKFPDVRQLTSATCPRHPDGPNKGRHKLYEGTEKSSYTCKYCGKKFPSILVMTGATCPYHPKGSNKGNHSPAL